MSVLNAVHAALSADADLAVLVDDRIFEHVPARARLPYVVLGRSVSRPWDTASDRGFRTELTLHVWSSSSRREEADAAVRRVEAAMTFDRLVPAFAATGTMRLINVVAGLAEIERLPDRGLVHATLRYRFTTEEIS